jgi:hypothetical protein
MAISCLMCSLDDARYNLTYDGGRMLKQTDLSGKVQAVLGLVNSDSLGITLYHEHLLTSLVAWYEELAEAAG